MQPTLNPDPDRSRDLALVFKFGVLRYKYDRGAIYLLRWESLLELVSYTGRNSLYDHDKYTDTLVLITDMHVMPSADSGLCGIIFMA